MIPLSEVMKHAREAHLDPSIIERDYVISWVLSGIYSNSILSQSLVFKGGTALRKVYFPNYRFSEDLDFTVAQSSADLTESALQQEIKNAIEAAHRRSGIGLQLVRFSKTREVFGGEAYEGKIEYSGPIRRRPVSLPRIKLDITFYEVVVFPAAQAPLIHNYSDNRACTETIRAYTLEEIVAEKLRTVLQRTRPRDIYDLWQLLVKDDHGLDRHRVVEGFQAKCEYKGVTFSGVDDFFDPDRLQSHEDHWETSLGHQLVGLPPFSEVVAGLKAEIIRTFGN